MMCLLLQTEEEKKTEEEEEEEKMPDYDEETKRLIEGTQHCFLAREERRSLKCDHGAH